MNISCSKEKSYLITATQYITRIYTESKYSTILHIKHEQISLEFSALSRPFIILTFGASVNKSLSDFQGKFFDFIGNPRWWLMHGQFTS